MSLGLPQSQLSWVISLSSLFKRQLLQKWGPEGQAGPGLAGHILATVRSQAERVLLAAP